MPNSKDHAISKAEAAETEESSYSVFTRTEKWCIVSMVAYAAWFSTVSSFIYYPAIPLLSEAFAVSVDKINLSVTCYMAVATVAPTLMGDAADVQGRRGVYVLALSLYVGSNVGMALANAYGAHLGLRVLQALAISGTFSIAYGVITDVAAPAERGTYVNVVSFATTIAPSLGPILGGVLSYAADWTWIFWFLSISSGVCLTMVVLVLPETSRTIVGNGAIEPPKHLKLPVPGLFCHWQETHVQAGAKRKMPNPLRSLAILLRLDNAIIALACGLLYVVYTCINASLSVLLVEIYDLDQWQTGLAYLPFGLGGVVSSFFTGTLMDRAYRKARTDMGLAVDVARGDDLDDFPIEKARLRVVWIPMVITCASVVAFGWVLQYAQHIAVPLSIQFVAGMCMQMDFSIYNTLLVEKNHRSPASAQASSNVVRCTLGAVAMAFLQELIDVIGVGWAFTFMGGLCFLAFMLFLVDYHQGTTWRQRSVAGSLETRATASDTP